MIKVHLTNAFSFKSYSNHLKQLPENDKRNRFGVAVSDYAIDQLILKMIYNPKDHILFVAMDEDEICGFGHMARYSDDAWELAVSVESDWQRKGVGNKLIGEMLAWAKFHKINEVFMHCIEENKVIQHLAAKHKLKTRERGGGERTAAIEVPEPNIFEINTQLFKEQTEIINQITELRGKLMSLWFDQKV